MKSKTSWFNKGILIDDAKKFSWIGIIYTLALFFVVPLRIIMVSSNKENTNYNYDMDYIAKNLFYYRNEILSFLTLIVPVIAAIFLFRYIQSKASVDMMHSLPVKRVELFRTHIIFGVIILVLPVLINALISLLLIPSMDLGKFYSSYDVWKWTGFAVLMDMVIFLTGVVAAMISGVSVVQGILTYIFLLLPLGVSMLVTNNVSIFVYGYVDKINNINNKLSPIMRIMGGYKDRVDYGYKDNMSIVEILVYIFICIGLYFLAKYLYEKRKLEAASQPITFRYLQDIFVYSVTFGVMLLAGSYFHNMQMQKGWVLFGYAVGSLIGFIVSEMLVKKSLWIGKYFKGYAVYAAIIIVLLGGMKIDIFGFEKKVPALESIDNIYFTRSFYELNSIDDDNKQSFYYDKNNIANIQELHKAIIKDKALNNAEKGRNKLQQIALVYNMKNGDKITRGYFISYENYAKYFKPIYENKEYKKNEYDVLSIDSSDMDRIIIKPGGGADKRAVILKPEDINEAIGILKEEVLNASYEDMVSETVAWGDINIMISQDKLSKYPKYDNRNNRNYQEVHLSWEKSYIKFEEWLKKKGYIDKARILPEDVSYVVVEKINSKYDWEKKFKRGELVRSNDKRLEITDKTNIENLLRSYKNIYYEKDKAYIVGFYSNQKNVINYGRIDEENAPDFIKNYFK